MDTQFNTLIRSYHDNFLQYRLSGDSGYENSYKSAQQGIESILSSLRSDVQSQDSQISSFYSDDVEGRLRELQSETRRAQASIVTDKDALEAAQLRGTASEPQSLTSRYIALGVLSAIAIGLSVM
jgi:hypothetical protein